jgi:hypothetical protein
MDDTLTFSVKHRIKMKSENFEILTYKTYRNLEKYNYNIKQLKEICKYYKLKSSGNKVTVQLRIYIYLKYFNSANIIQKTYRGHLVRKINRLKGLTKFNRESCNHQDFITLDDVSTIPYLQLFSINHNNHIYAFDITSIYDYMVKKNQKENPYDRTIFSDDIYNNLIELKRLTRIAGQETLFEVKEIKQKKTIYDIFHRIDELGNYSNIKWYEELNYINLINFYKELYDIWSYRAGITNVMKYNISNRDPFNNRKPNFYLQYSMNELKDILNGVMEKLLYNAINEEFQKLGAIYILTALTIVSSDAAEAMPWYYLSVI